jgi:hypothetical protein
MIEFIMTTREMNKYELINMKIGMSGSRDGMSDKALLVLQQFLKSNDIVEVHHGDCVGSDTIFHDQSVSFNIRTIAHPPNNDSNRSLCKSDTIRQVKPYLVRNKNIVDETDMLIAIPSTKDEIIRSGTWSTIRYAKKTNKKILIIFQDGTEQNIYAE